MREPPPPRVPQNFNADKPKDAASSRSITCARHSEKTQHVDRQTERQRDRLRERGTTDNEPERTYAQPSVNAALRVFHVEMSSRIDTLWKGGKNEVPASPYAEEASSGEKQRASSGREKRPSARDFVRPTWRPSGP